MWVQATVLWLSLVVTSAVVQIESLGCYKDKNWDRAVDKLEGKDALLDGHYSKRVNPIQKCAEAAKKRGFTVFVVQSGGWCAADAKGNYAKHGESSHCRSDGEGGPWSNAAYRITDPPTCFEPGLDYHGEDISFLGGGEESASPESCQRSCQANAECVYFTWRNESETGGLFNTDGAGQCFLKHTKTETPDVGHANLISGPKHCAPPKPVDEFADLKCWKNKVPQQMDNLERTDPRLDQYDYKRRTDAISKCHAVARDAGYDFFAVGNNGQCWAGDGETYKHYGQPRSCPNHGEGRYGVTHVYEIIRA